ncbi:MAG: tRNA (N(6)-L-threonylcarbamoyladenosine(37)-C(2))-methylthiotransferase MtaB [Thermosulfidibacteraceae bacterium]
MKVAILTIGCKLNQYESEYIVESFSKAGYGIVDFKEEADIYIINTCTVTSQADSKSRQAIRQAKRRNPKSIVVAVGCYAELKKDELKNIGADIVVGNVEKVFLVDIVKDYLIKGDLEDTRNISREVFYPMPVEDFKDYARAFVKVQDGCDSECSYCIVWKARGKPRSAEIDFVVEEVKRLVDRGFEEIVLTGVNLGSYGKDLGVSLVDLLKRLVKIDSLKKIRLSSIEPTEWSDELIDFVIHEKIAKHFHIPLQSGSDRILEIMNRKYKRKFFENIVLKLKEKIPIVGIGVDVIVGFPTETERDFLETYETIDQLPIYYMHIFTYSDRPGTLASILNPKVPPSVKRERYEALRKLRNEKMDRFISSFLGKKIYGVVEGRTIDGNRYTRALSENYIPILVEGDYSFLRCKVKIFQTTGKNGLNLVGKLDQV